MDRYMPHVPRRPSRAVPRSHSTRRWRDHDVHVEHVGDPQAPVRVLLVHGAGGNSAAMWPFAAHLAELGTYVTVPDLPGYGGTSSERPGLIGYDDWRQMLTDLVRGEHDPRPLILMGASVGGMLAYDVAATTGLVTRLIVTCLLDPREPTVRERLTWHPALARSAGPLLTLAAGPLAQLRLPLRWLADMRAISNDPGLVAEVIRDRRGGGGRVPLGWMRSFLESAPLVEPEDYAGPPVLLAHPGEDRWTPLRLSRDFFGRVAGAKTLVTLDGCGHFPVEEPGFTRLLEAVGSVLQEVRAPR
jgi:alpha-beta hydrolase superfamily lysophospholipase